MPSSDADHAAPRRDADDDHDLLTYGEAAVRLHEEIVAQRAVVESLQGDDPQLVGAQRRLQLLEDAADRNFRSRINDDNFERFFDYRGKAKRSN